MFGNGPRRDCDSAVERAFLDQSGRSTEYQSQKLDTECDTKYDTEPASRRVSTVPSFGPGLAGHSTRPVTVIASAKGFGKGNLCEQLPSKQT